MAPTQLLLAPRLPTGVPTEPIILDTCGVETKASSMSSSMKSSSSELDDDSDASMFTLPREPDICDGVLLLLLVGPIPWLEGFTPCKSDGGPPEAPMTDHKDEDDCSGPKPAWPRPGMFMACLPEPGPFDLAPAPMVGLDSGEARLSARVEW